MEAVVLGLGSNKSFNGKTPLENLSLACTTLSGFIGNLTVSSVYVTGAMYYENQDDFYNAVAAGWYEGSPLSLLEKIHLAESQLGRDRSNEFRNGPRSIDIDIEVFGRENINLPELIVPHERLLERAFVLVPFLEVLKLNADVKYKGYSFLERMPFTADFLQKKLQLSGNQKIERLSAPLNFCKL
ncbi:MAG: 2-amino-4-hydroxy-6-hydroxymethyldihydropteridine diphosphokinase [Treponema sp.]|nr:2-amino-4-hydroxy-6-hydroxymethyldihydropteridine diphosphokinase [Spirochaetia bacterium]MDY4903041.1 2-amino-4-hydroxy-6-hydroxymethyldihydropteridine diphosphokinase [Treponema sp.]